MPDTDEPPSPVMHVIDDLGVGGAQQVVAIFAREARRRGIPTVVTAIAPTPHTVVSDQLTAAGARVEVLGSRIRGPLGRVGQVAAMARLMRQVRPSVVQTHLSYANVLAVLAARLAGVRVVATVHNEKMGEDGNPPWVLRAETVMLRRLAHAVVAVGHRVAVAQRERLPNRVPHEVANAIEPPAAIDPRTRVRLRAELGAEDSSVLALAVGRLSDQKGHEDLLAAFAQARADLPDLRLAIAGEGPLRAHLEERARAWGIARDVCFLGVRGDVPDLMQACDLFVLASHWEGLPIAILEAAAAGRAVVSTRVGDIDQVIDDATAGVLVEPHSPDALAAALVELGADPARREALGAAARARAQRFAAAPWTDRLLAIYGLDPDGRPSTRRLRVVMLMQRYWPFIGGAERLVGDLAPRFQAHGVDVEVITRRLPGLAATEEVQGITVHRVPVPGPHAIASISYSLHSLRLMRRIKPDLVHAHDLLSPATTAAAARRLLRVPTVATVHIAGPLADITALQRGGRAGRARLRQIARWIDRFVVLSSQISAEVATIGVPQHRRTVIANGVDTTRFRAAEPGEQRLLREERDLCEGPLALFTGRLSPQKRIDVLLDIWPQVRAQVPGAQLVIAGTGECEQELRNRDVDGVLMIGPVEDTAPWYRAADVLVMASASEGMSVSMLEAMSSGIPVVMTAVSGTAEAIEHGRTGYLVDPERPHDLAEGLVTLLGDRARAREMGRAARQVVLSRYRLESTVQRHVCLYQEMVAERSRSRS